MYWEGEVAHNIDVWPNSEASFAIDINDLGQVIGAVDIAGVRRAFLWQNGEGWELNDLVNREPGTHFGTARAINEHGQIACEGDFEYESAVFLLSPIAPEPADLNADCRVDQHDLMTLLLAWGQANSPADLDGDGTVGFADVLLLLGAWG